MADLKMTVGMSERKDKWPPPIVKYSSGSENL
jgi:hypothetical protein